MKDFLALSDTGVDPALLRRILERARALRREREAGRANVPVLAGRTLAMIFEKPSLRTRVSFEQAAVELGGHAMMIDGKGVGLGAREEVGDVARVLEGMVQGIAARVFEHGKLEALAAHAGVPVINMLSDRTHPCQALGDALTLMDAFGTELAGRRIVFVGDGNNVARSLAWLAGHLGMHFTLASPPGYELPEAEMAALGARFPAMALELVRDPRAAVEGADAIYTDTWVSMGQEAEKAKRLEAFAGYAVNEALLGAAPGQAIVLHCLPAYRGVEISDAVMDGPRSRVFSQAHNRLHAQKGLLAELMGC